MLLVYMKKGLILVVSDILSLITVILCLIQKLPQIRDLYTYKSARGISLLSLYLELFSYTAMMLYNYVYEYAYLSYLEYPVLLIQEYILIYLVLKYKNLLVQNNNTYYAVGGYFAVVLLFSYNILPKFLLSLMVPFCTPIGATSKVIQLAEIIRTRDATTVSLMTWFLSAFTNLTRVYTVSVDSGDTMLLTNFTISFVLSAAVFLATYYYKKPRATIVIKRSVVLK